MLSGNVLHRPPCGLQYESKVHGSNRRGLGINRSTQLATYSQSELGLGGERSEARC